MIASIVDVGALWQTVWSAALAGVLVIVCCSMAVLGAARAHEHRSAGRGPAAAGPWMLLGLLGGASMTAVVVYGLALVVS